MFQKQVTVLYINKNDIELYTNPQNKRPAIAVPWKRDTLFKSLNAVFASHPVQSIKLLLHDDLVYVLPVEVTKASLKEAQTATYSILKESVPEELDERWDVLFTVSTKDSQKGTACVPVYAIFDQIAQTCIQRNVKLEGVLPVSFAEKLNSNPVVAISSAKHLFTFPLIISKTENTVKNTKTNEKPDEQAQTGSYLAHKKPQVRKSLKIALVVSIFFAAITNTSIVGYRLIQKQQVQTNVKAPRPTGIPSPTQVPLPELKTLTFEVLNGTETPGVAGETAKLLEEAGVKAVTTGNADRSDYTKTTVQASANLHNTRLLEMLKDIVKKGELTLGEELPASAEADIRIIVGSN